MEPLDLLRDKHLVRIGLGCLLLLLVACKAPAPPQKIRSDALQFKNNRAFLKGNLFTGQALSYYTNGQLQNLTNLVDGLRDGECLAWYENGQQKESRSYRHGQQEGPQIGWWPNGNLQFKATCKADAYEGQVSEWYDNGHPFRILHYQHGQEVGHQQAFMPDGRISANYIWKNNRIYGLKGDLLCETRPPTSSLR